MLGTSVVRECGLCVCVREAGEGVGVQRLMELRSPEGDIIVIQVRNNVGMN